MTPRPPHRQDPAPHARGFTLIEILVALTVVSVALVAGLQATGALTRLSARQSDQLLAQLCADNELAKLRLSRQLPGAGSSASVCTQAGQRLAVVVDVLPTPNPHFRRVDVRVNTSLASDDATSRAPAVTLLQVSTVVGRY
ncbi:MAG: type II secretion system protein GspI [Polaromonas sp.]|jgi:general secretion pathway protein I|nr:type II secretion system protein GspI [Polaromonas sp.]